MSLLEDIQADHDNITDEICSLAGMILVETCGAIAQDGRCRPVVAAIINNQTELRFPTWDNNAQKNRIFARISEELEEANADGTVCAFAGTYNPDEGKPTKAVIMMIQTAGWKQMKILPFKIKGNEVTWQEPIHTNNFESPLIRMSCAN